MIFQSNKIDQPLVFAMSYGVSKLLSWALISAPFSMRNLTIASLPVLEMKENQVCFSKFCVGEYEQDFRTISRSNVETCESQ